MLADHVLFDGVTGQSSGLNITVTNALTGSAHFVDPGQRNYHLPSNSAAIDAGANIGTLADVDGDARSPLA